MTQDKPAPRLIDLRIDWLAQYSPESNIFSPETNSRAVKDIPRIEGYLGATSASFLMLGRDPEDWSKRADRWHSLDDLITRCEAEFSGRLLIGSEDYDRWQNEPNGITWGVLGVGGFDSLVHSLEDLNHLPSLFERGIRVFQLIATELNNLSEDGRLSELGKAFFDQLDKLSISGPRPILDVAGMSRNLLDEVISWYAAESSRSDRILLMRSYGPIVREQIARIRELGGLVGLGASSRSFETLDSLQQAIENNRSGYGLATDCFGGGQALEGARTVSEFIDSTIKQLGPEVGYGLICENAHALIARSISSRNVV